MKDELQKAAMTTARNYVDKFASLAGYEYPEIYFIGDNPFDSVTINDEFYTMSEIYEVVVFAETHPDADIEGGIWEYNKYSEMFRFVYLHGSREEGKLFPNLSSWVKGCPYDKEGLEHLYELALNFNSELANFSNNPRRTK